MNIYIISCETGMIYVIEANSKDEIIESLNPILDNIIIKNCNNDGFFDDYYFDLCGTEFMVDDFIYYNDNTHKHFIDYNITELDEWINYNKVTIK